MAIKKYKRDSIFADLNDFCYLSKKNAYIEITKWHNGDGFDIVINCFQCTTISLTHGEIKAILKLTKLLNKEED